jgi:nucleotide-binding universal stress UspA family protein
MREFIGEAEPATDEDWRRAAEEQVRAELAGNGIAGVASARAVVGNPIREILAATREVQADLLVVGASGDSGKRVLGTTAVRCVRKAPTRVLVVPTGSEGRFQRTLACVDFSGLSPVVMTQAARMGHLDRGEVTAIHCYQMPWNQARWGPPPRNAVELEERFREELRRRYESSLLPHAYGHPVALHARSHGNYGDGIVEHARFIGADLVVLGTTGRTALATMLLGTTAEKVMRDVGCAVLAVKLPDAGPGAGERGGVWGG